MRKTTGTKILKDLGNVDSSNVSSRTNSTICKRNVCNTHQWW